MRKQREAYLAQLAVEYSKNRRTDEKAMEVFEQLAQNPECDMRWLQTLAMIYVVRKKWGRLKIAGGKDGTEEQKSDKIEVTVTFRVTVTPIYIWENE